MSIGDIDVRLAATVATREVQAITRNHLLIRNVRM
jgi:hypothetical protein